MKQERGLHRRQIDEESHRTEAEAEGLDFPASAFLIHRKFRPMN